MAIVETKIVSRPTTSIPFFNQTSNTALLALREELGPFTIVSDTETYYKSTNASGSHIVERTYSTDLLTQTNKVTVDSVSTWSVVDSAIGINLDKEYFAYATTNDYTHPTTNQYILTGIDTAFSCTTTYTYNSITDNSYFNTFISFLEVSDKLISFTNTGTQLIAVHTYTNSTDFTNTHWRDSSFVNFLQENGITRTISYALVSNDA
jgi:hypothetical protein